MKRKKLLSIISIIISVIIVSIKVSLDSVHYEIMSGLIEGGRYNAVRLLENGMIFSALYLLPALVALSLAMIGHKRKHLFHKFALGLAIFMTVHLLVPVGVLLAFI